MMEKSCKTCGFLKNGLFCSLDGGAITCGDYERWKPKDVNPEVVQNDLLKFSDICLGACSDKSCSTCKHTGDLFSDRCFSACFNHSLWEPKGSGIHAAQERSCVTCNKDVSSDCAECGDAYSLWEPKTSETIEEWVARSAKDAPMPGCVLTGSGAQSLKTGTFVFKTTLTDTQKKISEICDEVKNILLEKNRKYGDSALNPKRVFSKASPIEQINIRIDDKISRIMSAQDDDTEDAELDLIGYLILKRVAKKVLHDVQ